MSKTTQTEKKTTKPAAPKARKEYAGPAIEVSTLYSKQMPFKNCDAVAYAAIDDTTHTVQYFNLYNGRLTAGYRADPYIYALNDKTVKKLESAEQGWVEVPHHEWPFVVAPVAPKLAPAKRTRKAK